MKIKTLKYVILLSPSKKIANKIYRKLSNNPNKKNFGVI